MAGAPEEGPVLSTARKGKCSGRRSATPVSPTTRSFSTLDLLQNVQPDAAFFDTSLRTMLPRRSVCSSMARVARPSIERKRRFLAYASEGTSVETGRPDAERDRLPAYEFLTHRHRAPS